MCRRRWTNRAIKCWSGQDFDIDIFGAVDPPHEGIVVLPGARIRDKGTEQILRYDR
jgi:hypothetical protein